MVILSPHALKTPAPVFQKEFTKVLEIQANTWASKMFSYLKSCISQINLSQISLEESQRARAIDIYENLNRGGVSLDIFDLIMARVAQLTWNLFISGWRSVFLPAPDIRPPIFLLPQ